MPPACLQAKNTGAGRSVWCDVHMLSVIERLLSVLFYSREQPRAETLDTVQSPAKRQLCSVPQHLRIFCATTVSSSVAQAAAQTALPSCLVSQPFGSS